MLELNDRGEAALSVAILIAITLMVVFGSR